LSKVHLTICSLDGARFSVEACILETQQTLGLFSGGESYDLGPVDAGFAREAIRSLLSDTLGFQQANYSQFKRRST